MKNFSCFAGLLAGAAFALAAAPAVFAQVAGFVPDGAFHPMRSGEVFHRPLPTNGTVQAAPPTTARPVPVPVFNGRPLPTGNYGPVATLPEAPPHRYSGNGYANNGYANNGYANNGYANNGYANNGYANNGYANNGYANGSSTFTQLRAGWNGTPITTINDYGNSNYGNGSTNIPPIGPGNGFFNNLTPPIGPANGFFNTYNNAPNNYNPSNYNNALTDTQDDRRDHHHRDYPIYTISTLNNDNLIAGTPSLGGYYYGNYCDTGGAASTYPSVYSVYTGFPQYITSPGVTVTSLPEPVYVTPYQQFAAPNYSVTYNNNYYYVANAERAHDLEAGGDQAKAALQNAYPADSFQAAFGDIARAWTDSDIKPLRKHIRDTDTRINVSLNKKYSYSIASGDFVQITRDALDKLHTVSFEFTHIRKAKNGDVTAYGKHVYRAGAASAGGDNTQDGAIVPFDQAGSDTGTSANDPSASAADGTEKTVHVSYTLHHGDTQWYIIAVDSSEKNLITDDK